MTPNISSWKFCKVRKGDKIPYPKDWQNMPLTLAQIPVGDNYGLLSGPFSGVIAIDFDGLWAFNWWEENLPNVRLLDTIAWTSGRPNRIQFAYSVPEELWPHIQTVKFSNGLKKPDNEGIEFRWAGCQSVLPPSIHPDTGKPYEWIGVDEVAECPIDVLEFLVEKCTAHKPATLHAVPQRVSLDSSELRELDRVLSKYRQHYPNLSYDQWRDATWSCITHVGVNAGVAAMMTFYPEQVRGEYAKLAHNYNPSGAPSIGSLIHKIQEMDSSFRAQPKYKELAFVTSVIEKLIGEKE